VFFSLPLTVIWNPGLSLIMGPLRVVYDVTKVVLSQLVSCSCDKKKTLRDCTIHNCIIVHRRCGHFVDNFCTFVNCFSNIICRTVMPYKLMRILHISFEFCIMYCIILRNILIFNHLFVIFWTVVKSIFWYIWLSFVSDMRGIILRVLVSRDCHYYRVSVVCIVFSSSALYGNSSDAK